jgi:hypothetical protein
MIPCIHAELTRQWAMHAIEAGRLQSAADMYQNDRHE